MCCHPLLKGLREHFYHPLVKKRFLQERLGSSIATGERKAGTRKRSEGGWGFWRYAVYSSSTEDQTNNRNHDLESVTDTWAKTTGLISADVNPLTMSSIWNLHCLYSLGPSSPDFLRRLHSLFRYDEEEQCLSALQGSELTRLLDFLDRVRTLLSAFRPATKRAPQTLDAIPSNDDIYIRCLRKLQGICAHHDALPPSYSASGEIARVGYKPVVIGGISDVWEGTCRKKRVSIEHLKVSLNDDRARKKVRVWHGRPLIRVYLRTPVRAAVIHQTGSYVEKAETSEYRSFRRDDREPAADHLEVDATRNSDRFHREKSRCEPDQPCQSFSVRTLRTPMTPFLQVIGCG